MKARPILFSGPMIRALLVGTKTQTRRVLKPSKWAEKYPVLNPNGIEHGAWWWDGVLSGVGASQDCPYGKPGDFLWVKESHRLLACECTETCRVAGHVHYSADESGYEGASMQRLRPSIHMPRWASRLTLRITEVRVQRLQEISEDDACAEGCPNVCMRPTGDDNGTAIHGPDGYIALWESINGPGSWDANPWVWCISFEVIKANVDKILKPCS